MNAEKEYPKKSSMLNQDFLRPHLQKMTLLCVDDSQTTQLIYKSVFEIIFGKVLTVSNGQEGWEVFKNEAVDIIITDYSMPVMNGIEMIEKIRSSTADIPIVLVTAIDETEVIVKALNLGVHNFLYKPFDVSELSESIENAAKVVIANDVLKKEQQERAQLLQEKAYHTYQEELSFRKELTILRNDFYYQRYEAKKELLIDLMYSPLDILSGDAYSVRRIGEDQILFILIDGMGKGLSASLSAMIFASFINHSVDSALQTQAPFDLKKIIESSIEFIKKVLLDEELLSVEFIVIDKALLQMHYALFSMPSLLLHYEDDTVTRLNSNNPPITKYHSDVTIDSVSLQKVQKLLFLSDGLIENSVEEGMYLRYLENDFKSSFTREEFKKAIFSRITEQEDDITFIFLNFLERELPLIEKRRFLSTLEDVDRANIWYESVLKSMNIDTALINKALLSFNELYMNAFEHGSLEIDNTQKEKLIASDRYLEYLQDNANDKPIYVTIQKLTYNQSHNYLLTTIDDPGKGFDTQLLSTIFRNREKFNGKGVFISHQASCGMYYSSKANSVLFLHRID